MKILVVDDSKAIRQLVGECVKSLGHEVVFADDGEACVHHVAENEVDLVLMDVEMPRLNGVEATKIIREHKKADWFPIIFLTTRVDDDSFADGILAGGDAYLNKPLNPLRLQLTVIAMERIYLMRQRLYQAQRDLKIANEELERLSLFDALTDLANRRHFDASIEREFALARRNKSPLSVIFCDVDFFKLYNDSYGHRQGDVCLVRVAESIKRCVRRPSDMAARYGGEEFIVLLPSTHLQGARHLAEMIRQAVWDCALPHQASKIAQQVSLSLGVATYNGQYVRHQELVEAADSALYKAKEQGRNRVEIA
ncbi:MAG: diguanylate cyclase [Methylomonas sp.]|nr:diguanylate cyclase [Methylomonas sp.]